MYFFKQFRLLWIPLLLVISSVRASAQALPATDIAWLPLTDEERQMTTPKVEKDAGVEALFWRVHVYDESQGPDLQRVFYHYVRLKIFSEKGKESASTIDIEFGDHTNVTSVTGRTVKADGTILELKKDAVYQRDIVRAGTHKRKVKSFAMPGVEPGGIVEYRWKEIQFNSSMQYMRLEMQREYPVRQVTYFLKPLPREESAGFTMSVYPFNCKPTPLKLEHDGYSSMTLENVPAFHEEPMMPGRGDVRSWALAFYHTDSKRDPDKYWADIGKRDYGYLKTALKVNNEIKGAAEKAVAGAATDEAKSLALIIWLRANVRDLFDRSVSDAERAAVLKSTPKDRERTSAEVFKSGIGTADELNVLFAAMCTAVGLEARPVLVGNRDDMVFSPRLTDEYFLKSIDMAVKIGDDWRIFDVSTRHLDPKMIGWREEGSKVLVSDPKKPFFIDSKLSAPEASAHNRTAKFTLSDDGTLEGDVEETMTGHVAEDSRRDLEGQEAAKQSEDLKKRITKVFPQAEVSECSFGGVATAEKPLTVRYHISIPNYAQRTGKRLLLQPLYFQRGEAPLFESSERRYDVIFPFAWQEADQVHIRIPAGFNLDNAENPGGIDFGPPGSYGLRMAVTKAHDELIIERQFAFGRQGIITFPVNVYQNLKGVFDAVHSRDNVTISLAQGTAAPGVK